MLSCEHFTDGSIEGEEDGEEDKLPDEGDDGGDQPDHQQAPHLLHSSHHQQHVRQPIPSIYTNTVPVLFKISGTNHFSKLSSTFYTCF